MSRVGGDLAAGLINSTPAAASTTLGTQMFQTQCPLGAGPGDTVPVIVDGSQTTVVVPPGINAGQTFMIQMPPATSTPPPTVVASPAATGANVSPQQIARITSTPTAASTTQMFQTQCPLGASPGDTVPVIVDGAQTTVVVPPGINAGQTFMIQMPSAMPLLEDAVGFTVGQE
jgi:hypothetical protein